MSEYQEQSAEEIDNNDEPSIDIFKEQLFENFRETGILDSLKV